MTSFSQPSTPNPTLMTIQSFITMATQIPKQPRKFATKLTEYSTPAHSRSGPYQDDLDLDALIVGAGFGEPLHKQGRM
jgi:hypothetical protein